MDKYNLVLDIIEHPEKYSTESLNKLLSHPETREIYKQICETKSALKPHSHINVEHEWENFISKTGLSPIEKQVDCIRHSPLWMSSRAASIAVCLVTSLVAVAIGVMLTVNKLDHNPAPDNTSISSVVPEIPEGSEDKSQTTVAPKGDVKTISPILFENASLNEIIKEIEAAYGVSAEFTNPQAGDLRLYYCLNPSLTLDETVGQLNTFEQIDIHINGNTLIIK